MKCIEEVFRGSVVALPMGAQLTSRSAIGKKAQI